MSKVAAASNYEIMTIIKDETEVRLEGKTVAFDYYESILSPNITANIYVLDTGNSVAYQSYYDSQERMGSIYNALPLTGREKLKFVPNQVYLIFHRNHCL